MGGSDSKPGSLSTSHLSASWRETQPWTEEFEQSLREEIQRIEPKEKPSILLVGPVNAGKSSFVNAVLSVSKRHIVHLAATDSGPKSCTTSYDKYTDNTLLHNFRLRDSMGLEQSAEEGFNVADMISLLKGHIRDGYKFNPRSPISPADKEHWRANPKFGNQTHCVVFVIDANAMHTGIPQAFLDQIRQLQKEVKRLRIQRVLILTKADVLCEEVQKDPANMFQSTKVKEAVKIAREVFDIAEGSIHPVMNYEDAIDISWKRNIPLLLALRQITQYANDMIDAFNEHSDSD